MATRLAAKPPTATTPRTPTNTQQALRRNQQPTTPQTAKRIPSTTAPSRPLAPSTARHVNAKGEKEADATKAPSNENAAARGQGVAEAASKATKMAGMSKLGVLGAPQTTARKASRVLSSSAQAVLPSVNKVAPARPPSSVGGRSTSTSMISTSSSKPSNYVHLTLATRGNTTPRTPRGATSSASSTYEPGSVTPRPPARRIPEPASPRTLKVQGALLSSAIRKASRVASTSSLGISTSASTSKSVLAPSTPRRSSVSTVVSSASTKLSRKSSFDVPPSSTIRTPPQPPKSTLPKRTMVSPRILPRSTLPPPPPSTIIQKRTLSSSVASSSIPTSSSSGTSALGASTRMIKKSSAESSNSTLSLGSSTTSTGAARSFLVPKRSQELSRAVSPTPNRGKSVIRREPSISRIPTAQLIADAVKVVRNAEHALGESQTERRESWETVGSGTASNSNSARPSLATTGVGAINILPPELSQPSISLPPPTPSTSLPTSSPHLLPTVSSNDERFLSPLRFPPKTKLRHRLSTSLDDMLRQGVALPDDEESWLCDEGLSVRMREEMDMVTVTPKKQGEGLELVKEEEDDDPVEVGKETNEDVERDEIRMEEERRAWREEQQAKLREEWDRMKRELELEVEEKKRLDKIELEREKNELEDRRRSLELERGRWIRQQGEMEQQLREAEEERTKRHQAESSPPPPPAVDTLRHLELRQLLSVTVSTYSELSERARCERENLFVQREALSCLARSIDFTWGAGED